MLLYFALMPSNKAKVTGLKHFRKHPQLALIYIHNKLKALVLNNFENIN